MSDNRLAAVLVSSATARILIGIDHYEVDWMTEEQWQAFRSDPFRFCITAAPEDYDRIWAVVEARQPKNTPALSLGREALEETNMRTPTTQEQLRAHHAASLAGERPGVDEDTPECGWYRMRMIKGGPWVPVEVRCLQDIEDGELTEPEVMVAIVGSERETKHWRAAWPRCSNKPITEDAYHELVYSKDETFRATHAPVDLTEKASRP